MLLRAMAAPPWSIVQLRPLGIEGGAIELDVVEDDGGGVVSRWPDVGPVRVPARVFDVLVRSGALSAPGMIAAGYACTCEDARILAAAMAIGAAPPAIAA